MGTEQTCRIFVIDDHEVVREGVRRAAEGHDDEFDVVGEAGGYEEALGALTANGSAGVDVAIVDLLLPDGDGIMLCREIRSHDPDVQCILHTHLDDLQALLGARIAGAAAYVLKSAPADELLDAVRAAAAGHSQLREAPISELLAPQESPAGESRGALADLTPQEWRIFHLIGEGLTNRDIGDELHLAEKTVRNYVSNMYAKLGISRRAEAAALAGRLAERRRAAGRDGGYHGRISATPAGVSR